MAIGDLAYSDDALVTSVSPLLEDDDVVYLRADLGAAATSVDQLPYKVLKGAKTQTDGAGLYMDSTLTTRSDSSAALSVSIVEGVDDTAPEYPYFYRLQRIDVTSGAALSTIVEVHEVDVVTLVGALILLDAVVWTDPTPA